MSKRREDPALAGLNEVKSRFQSGSKRTCGDNLWRLKRQGASKYLTTAGKKILFLIFLTLLTLQTQRTQQTFSQWYKQQIPVNQNIYGIKFIDTLNGWICTSKYNATQTDTAFILHTTNGGTNWFIQFYKPTIQGYSAITMVNNMVGYAAGDSLYPPFGGGCILLKTTNGGLNWFNIPIPYNQIITQFYFLNPDTGWETDNAASGPDIRLTTNGGYTWQLKTNGITDYPTSSVFFFNYDTGFCGSGLNLYKTINAGLNWNLVKTVSTRINSLFFLNEFTGWGGLSPDTTDKVIYTSNGGSSWIIQNIGSPYNFNIKDIFFFNNQIGFACTGFNKICKTVNSGFPWGYQNDSTGTNNMSFIDSLHGWTGNLGISHTSNGGGPVTYIGIINLSNKIPQKYKLFQNYPNPFNPNTKIRFSLVRTSFVKLNIYDVNGKEKVIWNSDKELSAGEHELNFDGSNYSSGTYFYQLIVTDLEGKEVFRGTKKMILLK